MKDEPCYECARLRVAVEKLEDEVVQLYAALKACTKDNLEMRQRLQSWADDFDGYKIWPGGPANRTEDACGAGFRQHNSRTGNN